MIVSNEWIREHQHALDGFVPRIELTRPNGSKDTITIKNKEAEREVVKIMRENRKRGKAK